MKDHRHVQSRNQKRSHIATWPPSRVTRTTYLYFLTLINSNISAKKLSRPLMSNYLALFQPSFLQQCNQSINDILLKHYTLTRGDPADASRTNVHLVPDLSAGAYLHAAGLIGDPSWMEKVGCGGFKVL